VPDSPRKDARLLRRALPLALGILALAVGGCGGVPSIHVPSIPDISKTGGATFIIDGNSFQVSQSGSIQADFGHPNPLTYSGPDGCAGHYFTADYTEDIQVFFRYSKKRAFLLIDNGGSPVYRFGPPIHTGNRLTFSNPTPSDRRITVIVTCPTGA
jgi:hypothetical protein